MKNRLLPLLFVLGGFSAYSQVGIGKLDPNPSAQLEVFATDKGVLIPRVTLTGSTDVTTIKNGNVNSLLVFNTASVSDVKPGYYYWFADKWIRIAISGEATESTNVIIGTGVPGDKGQPGYPGEGVNLYTDKDSGIVYVQNANGTWSSINGKNGIDGKNGISGGTGLPGDAGLDATIQMYVDYTTGIVYVRDPKDATKWVPLNGTNGIDGKNGISGGTGLPGDAGLDATIQMYVDYTTGIVYVRDPKDATKWVPLNGTNGIDGKNGISGGTGLPGDAGLDATIQMYVDYTTGIVYVRDPKDATKWVPLNGTNGIDGKNGISGGTGLPGDAGLDATIQMYVDYTTGIVYVRDPKDATKWVPLNGTNGIDGKNGISGGTGLPGDAGLDATIQMYVDYTTGIVYVRDPKDATKWVPLNGTNGIDGKNGISGGTGLPGDAGLDATIQMYVDYTTGIVYVRDPKDATKWVPLNGTNGIDGKNGISGGTGLPGDAGLDATIQMYVDYTTGIVYVRDPKDATKWVPLNGTNGIDGKNGISGGTGLPGDAGLDATIQMYVDYTTGIVYVRDPKDATKWVPLNGTNGIDGKNGISGGTGLPGDAGLDATIQMYVDYTTGIVYVRDPKDATKWVPLNGTNGIDGKNGISGGTGLPGDAGLDATIQMYVDYTTGIVYVRDPKDATKWVPLNGTNGIDGKNGISGGTGLPGDAGLDATIQMYVDYTTGIVYVRDPKDATKWVPLNGTNGIDGKNGISGGTGLPGDAGLDATIQMYVDYTTGIVYVRDPKDATKWVPLNGTNGIDGKNGISGGTGLPGDAGLDATIQMYVDYTTGIVYVRDPKDATKWVPLNGTNGIDGKNGISGGTGLPGDAGLDATIQMYVDYTTGIVYVRDPKDATKWVPLNGTNGIDGKNGISGGTGLPGDAGLDATIQMYVDYTTGIVYVRDPKDATKWVPLNGTNGIDGKNGISGGTGLPGDAGLDATIQMYVDYTTGIVYVRDPKDATKWVPLNGTNGIDGKNGISGGTGLPGDAGLDATIQMYVDYTTGIVYVRDPKDATKWVPLNGTNGIDGKNGISGGTGLPGDAGLDATIQMYVDYTTGIVYVRDPKDATKWVPLNGTNGIDGKNGISGGTGLPGDAGLDATIQMYVDYTTGIVYVRDPKDATKWVPLNGTNGIDGKNGISGGTGLPGDAGLDATIQMYVDYTTGIVYVRDPKDATKWVPLNGTNGIDGKNGISGGTGLPGDAGLDATIQMYVDYTTGIVYVRDPKDATKWVPLNGTNGIDGKNGISGGTGLPGDAGLDATIQMYVDYTTGIVYVRDPKDATKWVPLNGTNGMDGKNGIAGGSGVPGAEGTAGIDGTIQMYIDYNTGIVYVRDPKDATKWVPLNGKEGNNGKDGLAGGSGVPGAAGTAGIDGVIQMYIDYNTNIVYVRDPEDATKWVPLSGTGPKGDTGADGVTSFVPVVTNGNTIATYKNAEGNPAEIKETVTSLAYDKTLHALVYDDEKGSSNSLALNDLVGDAETKTTLVLDNATKTLTYNGEGQISSIIDLKDITTTTPATVLEVTGSGATFTAATVNLVPSTVKGSVLTTNDAGVVEWKAPAKANVMGIKVTSADYTVGDADYTIIASKLTQDITINLPAASENTGRLLLINQYNVVKDDGTAIIVHFNTEVKYSDAASYSYLAFSLAGGVTKGSAKITLQSDGKDWYVVTYTM